MTLTDDGKSDGGATFEREEFARLQEAKGRKVVFERPVRMGGAYKPEHSKQFPEVEQSDIRGSMPSQPVAIAARNWFSQGQWASLPSDKVGVVPDLVMDRLEATLRRFFWGTYRDHMMQSAPIHTPATWRDHRALDWEHSRLPWRRKAFRNVKMLRADITFSADVVDLYPEFESLRNPGRARVFLQWDEPIMSPWREADPQA